METEVDEVYDEELADELLADGEILCDDIEFEDDPDNSDTAIGKIRRIQRNGSWMRKRRRSSGTSLISAWKVAVRCRSQSSSRKNRS